MFGRKKSRFDLAEGDEDLLVTEATDLPAPAAAATPALAEPPRQRALPPAASAPTSSDTTVGRGVKLEGTLRFKGRARIDGELHGKVSAGDHLEVGQDGFVGAQLAVRTVTILGKVDGNVVAGDSVEIQAGGRMQGDIRTPAFHVHRGAIFNGHCQMGEG